MQHARHTIYIYCNIVLLLYIIYIRISNIYIYINIHTYTWNDDILLYIYSICKTFLNIYTAVRAKKWHAITMCSVYTQLMTSSHLRWSLQNLIGKDERNSPYQFRCRWPNSTTNPDSTHAISTWSWSTICAGSSPGSVWRWSSRTEAWLKFRRGLLDWALCVVGWIEVLLTCYTMLWKFIRKTDVFPTYF